MGAASREPCLYADASSRVLQPVPQPIAPSREAAWIPQREQSMSSTAPPARLDRAVERPPMGIVPIASQVDPNVLSTALRLAEQIAAPGRGHRHRPQRMDPSWGGSIDPESSLEQFHNAVVNSRSPEQPLISTVVKLVQPAWSWLHGREQGWVENLRRLEAWRGQHGKQAAKLASFDDSPTGFVGGPSGAMQEAWYNRSCILLMQAESLRRTERKGKKNRAARRREKSVFQLIERENLGHGRLPQGKPEDIRALVIDLNSASVGVQLPREGRSGGKASRFVSENLSWSLLQVAEPPPDVSAGIAIGVWRLHCVSLKALPLQFKSKADAVWQLQGENADQNRLQLQPGILEVHLPIEKGKRLHVQAGAPHCCGRGRRIKRVLLTEKLTLCMEHRQPDEGLSCLCSEAVADTDDPGLPAVHAVPDWECTADYVAAWKPLVELEAASTAVEDCESCIIYDMEVFWKAMDDGSVLGSFYLAMNIAVAHRLAFRRPIEGEDGLVEWSSGWLCLRRELPGGTAVDAWCGHGAIVDCVVINSGAGVQSNISRLDEEDPWSHLGDEYVSGSRLRVDFRLIVTASDAAPLPEQVQTCGKPLRGYVAEFLPKPFTQNCQAVALAELGSSSDLLKEVVLSGQCARPSVFADGEDGRGRIMGAESSSWHVVDQPYAVREDLTPWRLNPPQEAAVSSTLKEPLSLIHGPPGTGKTRTAATLAVLFALRNTRAGSPAAVFYCAPSNDAADVACLRVTEIAADHFECLSDVYTSEVTDGEECAICMSGACDVKTVCGHMFHAHCLSQALEAGNAGCPLCRRPLRQYGDNLNTLRVYSREIERTDFPVPSRLACPSARPRKPQPVPDIMRKHALHWRCHAVAPDVVPTEEAIKAKEAYARLCRAEPGDLAFDKYRSEYLSALSEARAAEVQRADVIFATCMASCRAALLEALGEEMAPIIKQVIVDEAGQSTEPETLCPLTTAKGAEHIVLVGDPKQLQPIIRNQKAQQLGLGVSLLERLSSLKHARPWLLSLQYRMHPDINAFPSKYYYNGAIESDVVVEMRPPGLLEHPQRPGCSTALLFCASSDSPGEMATHVRTADVDAMCRFNEPEARLAAKIAYELSARVGSSNVAVLSWYNAQVTRINGLLHGSHIHVGAVVSAQGNEWDYVVLSTVRTTKGRLGSLADDHLLDVALTRAHRGLLVLGHPETLRGLPAWKAFVEHCEQQGVMTDSEPHLLPALS